MFPATSGKRGEVIKHCSLFGTGPWPFVVFPLMMLAPLLFFKWHSIEQDIAQSAQHALLSAGINWASVETINRGRDVLITGTPPSEQAIEIARTVVSASDGVNSVSTSSDVAPPNMPAELDLSIKAKASSPSLLISGELQQQGDIDIILDHAISIYGRENVSHHLSVDHRRAKLPDLNRLIKELKDKSYGSETLTASLSGSTLSLKGTIVNSAAKASLVEIAQSLGLKFEPNSTLEIAPPPIKRDVCQDLVNKLLAEGKINFALSKTSIENNSFELLESIKSTALRCPDASFEVSGHTDTTGDIEFNNALSKQRAQAVVDHLVNLGLNTTQFTAVGYGSSRPLGDNSSEAGRAENRRIEFKLKNAQTLGD